MKIKMAYFKAVNALFDGIDSADCDSDKLAALDAAVPLLREALREHVAESDKEVSL